MKTTKEHTKAGTLEVGIDTGYIMESGDTLCMVNKQLFPPVDFAVLKVYAMWIITGIEIVHMQHKAILTLDEVEKTRGRVWTIEGDGQ